MTPTPIAPEPRPPLRGAGKALLLLLAIFLVLVVLAVLFPPRTWRL